MSMAGQRNNFGDVCNNLLVLLQLREQREQQNNKTDEGKGN